MITYGIGGQQRLAFTVVKVDEVLGSSEPRHRAMASCDIQVVTTKPPLC
jgi:hypothetical protein